MAIGTTQLPAPVYDRNVGCPECIGMGVLEATDLFCGAGGSSLGLEFVCCPRCGRQLIEVTQCLNHWALAVEAHNANFPNADHDTHDVEVIPPWRFRRTPLLWASPECVHHAYCRGKKDPDDPAAERSRATMNDVVRFAEFHRYDAIIVENVIEARLWEHFDSWFASIEALGYTGRIVYFNSQFALPTPQSRDRMYCIFWRNGVPEPDLYFMPTSWCDNCEKVVRGRQWWKKPSKGSARSQPGKFHWGRYGAQYVYVCEHCSQNVAPAVVGAKSALDWSLPMTKIGDRLKPLAEKTRQRIKTGVERLNTTRPITVQVGGNLYERPGYARVWSVDYPLRTITTTPYMGLVVQAGGPEGSGRRATGLEEPLGTVLGENHKGVVLRVGGQGASPRTDGEPFSTIIGSDRQMAFVIPENGNGNGHNGNGHDDRQMLVRVNRGGDRRAQDIGEPTPTIAGHGELGLVSFRNHGDVAPIDMPAHTVVAGGYHHGLIAYHGNPGFVRDADDAMGTITSRDKQSLLIPYFGTANGGRPTEIPMGTVTSKDREALVITDAYIDECGFRMLQWTELLRAQQMHMRPDGTPYQLTARRKNKRGKFVELSNELRTRMIGNAVSSPVATMLGRAVVESLMAA